MSAINRVFSLAEEFVSMKKNKSKYVQFVPEKISEISKQIVPAMKGDPI